MEDISKYPNHLKADKSKDEVDNINIFWNNSKLGHLGNHAEYYGMSRDFLKVVAEHLTVETAKQQGWKRVKILCVLHS